MLIKQYQDFFDAQTQLKKTSKRLLYNKLKIFPEPDGLTPDWFRKRIRTLSPHTARYDKTVILQVLKFLGQEEQLHSVREVKLPRSKPTVTVDDLYTKEELEGVFTALDNTRDRAMVEVLYESACRVGELISMNLSTTTLNTDGTATIVVSGKTGTRQIIIYNSVPALRNWINHHPRTTDALWTGGNSMKRVARPRVYDVVQGALKKARITGKRRILHMFRHTRITELVRLGVRGPPLWRFVGWSNGKQEIVYVHLSTHDVEQEMRAKVFGMKSKETTPQPLITSRTCPQCGMQNEPFAQVCSNCNSLISTSATTEIQELKEQVRMLRDMMLESEPWRKAKLERDKKK